MTDIKFRRAKLSDLPHLIAMMADDELGVFREDAGSPTNPRYLRAFEAIASDPNQYLFVAERQGAVVGSLQLTLIPGLSRLGMWRGQIEGVRISRDERGGGIGSQMIRFAIEECRRRECGMVQLTTDKTREEAHRFYASLGFVASHEGMKLMLAD